MVYEDYTTYTEVDVGANRITFTGTTKITHSAYRDETTYLYDDKGAGHFGNFEHLLQAECDFINVSCVGVIWLLANALNDRNGLNTANEKHEDILFFEHNVSGKQLRFNTNDGTGWTVDTYSCLANTIYYLTVKRVGTTGTLKIYSDSARTVLLDTLALTQNADTYQYIYACNTHNSGLGVSCTSIIEKLDLQEAAPTTTDKNIPTYFNSKFITHH